MTDMNEWIKERKRIHGAATPGPWDDSGGGEIDQHWSCPTPYREVVSTDVSCMSFCYGGTSRGILEDEDSAAIVDAHNNIPYLLTAVEKVLELHKPDTVFAWTEDCTDPDNHTAFTDVRSGDMLCEDEPLGQFCAGCVPENDTTIDLTEYSWPCDTYRAIEGAINE